MMRIRVSNRGPTGNAKHNPVAGHGRVGWEETNRRKEPSNATTSSLSGLGRRRHGRHFGGAGLVASNTTAAAAAPKSRGSVTVPNQACTYLGVADTCDITVTQFRVVDGVITAFGTVHADTANVTSNFSAPVQFNQSAAAVQVAATCPILDLTLGPLHLDLLGLVVDLNQVHLQITAESGPGNLLGNLLCAVAGLLAGTGGGGAIQNLLQSIVGLLNQILAAL
jgi:hypothetical protein